MDEEVDEQVAVDEDDDLESMPGIIVPPNIHRQQGAGDGRGGARIDEIGVQQEPQQPQPQQQQQPHQQPQPDDQGQEREEAARPVERGNPPKNWILWISVVSVVVMVLAIGVGYSMNLYKDRENCQISHNDCITELQLCKSNTDSCHETVIELARCKEDKARWDGKEEGYNNQIQACYNKNAQCSECEISNASNKEKLDGCQKNLDKCAVTVEKYNTLVEDNHEFQKKCGTNEVQWNNCKDELQECKAMDTRKELNDCQTDYKLDQQDLNEKKRKINMYAAIATDKTNELNKCNNEKKQHNMEKSQWEARQQQQHDMIEEYQSALKEIREKLEQLNENHTLLRIECAKSEVEHKYALEKIDDHAKQQVKLEKLFESLDKKYNKLSKDMNNFMANERYNSSKGK